MQISELEIYFILFSCIVLFVSFAIFGIYLFKRNIKNIKENIIEKELMKTQFKQQLLQTQLEIQEQTLKTISEEIHDNVGQVLSLAKLNLNTFENNPTKKLEYTKELISKVINDLRDLSRSMHGDRITELGLLQSLTDELQILQNSGEFETHLQVKGDRYKLSIQKEIIIFRIVQEALNNAIKHAKAKNITLRLNYQPQMFSLNIEDDGIGFETIAQQNKNGIGLKSMQNRAQLIGASCTLQSINKKGTSITITLPTLTNKP